MEDKTTYKVKVRYEGTDGYGFGYKRRATRTFKFKSIEEAKAFEPTILEEIEGHGVYSYLSPISKEIFEETSSKKRIE